MSNALEIRETFPLSFPSVTLMSEISGGNDVGRICVFMLEWPGRPFVSMCYVFFGCVNNPVASQLFLTGASTLLRVCPLRSAILTQALLPCVPPFEALPSAFDILHVGHPTRTLDLWRDWELSWQACALSLCERALLCVESSHRHFCPKRGYLVVLALVILLAVRKSPRNELGHKT